MASRPEWDQLLVAARAGDARALCALLEAAREDLHSAAAGVLGKSARLELPVDDLFEEAVLSALKELHSLRATSYVGFRVWFTTIAHNHVCRMMRRARSRPRVVTESEVDGLEPLEDELSPEGPDQVFVRDALQRLPRTQQAAFVLREGMQLSWRTIGFVLERRGIPAARLLHYRAAQRMKGLLEACVELRAGAPVLGGSST